MKEDSADAEGFLDSQRCHSLLTLWDPQVHLDIFTMAREMIGIEISPKADDRRLNRTTHEDQVVLWVHRLRAP